ncbi:MAG: hypothetical protein MRY32_01915 [Rickettsiales bacterium]|nr:hypothetical protein [Rickettsiales bacterium]
MASAIGGVVVGDSTDLVIAGARYDPAERLETYIHDIKAGIHPINRRELLSEARQAQLMELIDQARSGAPDEHGNVGFHVFEHALNDPSTKGLDGSSAERISRVVGAETEANVESERSSNASGKKASSKRRKSGGRGPRRSGIEWYVPESLPQEHQLTLMQMNGASLTAAEWINIAGELGLQGKSTRNSILGANHHLKDSGNTIGVLKRMVNSPEFLERLETLYPRANVTPALAAPTSSQSAGIG